MASGGVQGRLSALYNDAKEYFADGGITLDKHLILKVSTILAGLFLIVAGIIGSSAIVLGGGFVYFVGSLYAIVWGVLVQASTPGPENTSDHQATCILLQIIEIKNKFGEPPERIKPFHRLLDFYLKFLMLQRGKGLFYMGTLGAKNVPYVCEVV